MAPPYSFRYTAILANEYTVAYPLDQLALEVGLIQLAIPRRGANNLGYSTAYCGKSA